jgi:broad specificity phosphatase PhoE
MAGSTEQAHNRIVLIRHGQTEWSSTLRHTGRTDIPLTDLGRTEARSAGDLLDQREFALVLVSPLSRARETCELAGYLDQAGVDDDLVEWDYGVAEGRTTAEIRTETPDWLVWGDDTVDAEKLAEVGARADRVIARCLEADGDVALFGHGHALRILTARWCNMDPVDGQRFPLGTATLSELGWEHDYRTIWVWNSGHRLPS